MFGNHLKLWCTEFTSPVDGHKYGRNVFAPTWEDAQACDAGGIGEQVLGECGGFGILTPDGPLTLWKREDAPDAHDLGL